MSPTLFGIPTSGDRRYTHLASPGVEFLGLFSKTDFAVDADVCATVYTDAEVEEEKDLWRRRRIDLMHRSGALDQVAQEYLHCK